jgi:hypothetical protein
MKLKKIIKDWIYNKAIKIIATRLVNSRELLTPQYLTKRGWVEKDGYYTEFGVKNRDLITIQFENHFYRVWHSDKLTFIAIENSIEWFEMYYLLIHIDNARYELAGV